MPCNESFDCDRVGLNSYTMYSKFNSRGDYTDVGFSGWEIGRRRGFPVMKIYILK